MMDISQVNRAIADIKVKLPDFFKQLSRAEVMAVDQYGCRVGLSMDGTHYLLSHGAPDDSARHRAFEHRCYCSVGLECWQISKGKNATTVRHDLLNFLIEQETFAQAILETFQNTEE